VVSVRRTDEAARPLIAPDAVYFLRANLALQLQAARLALLRSEQALFRQSLDDATAWLREYYDIDSTPVKGALRTIAEIRESSFDTSLPDISESLRLLRQYIAFRRAADAGDDAAASGVQDAEAEPER
jgi:uroporphyrin-3 C-methyltransferase